MNGWTKERREKQSLLIHRWRPWEQSTGPRSEEGKVAVSNNALKHGARSKQTKELRSILAELNHWRIEQKV